MLALAAIWTVVLLGSVPAGSGPPNHLAFK
jgi:hypothetical protein